MTDTSQTPLQTPKAKAKTPPRKRGIIRPMTREASLARARSIVGERGKLIRYSMKAGYNGGTDPDAFDPASHYKTLVTRLERASCDCVGLQTWLLGFDRKQRDFAPGWDWANTDSMIVEAQTRAQWFEIIPWPEAACLVVYRSIDLDHDGERDRVGHVGMVTGMVDAHGKPLVEFEWDAVRLPYKRLRVTHCSLGNDQKLGRAIAETDGSAWAGREYYKGHHDPRWASVFLRYRRFVVGA